MGDTALLYVDTPFPIPTELEYLAFISLPSGTFIPVLEIAAIPHSRLLLIFHDRSASTTGLLQAALLPACRPSV